MDDRTIRVMPLVPLATMSLTAVLLVLVVGLFFVVDRILEHQVTQALREESQEWADSLAGASAKVLWNFDENAVQLLGDSAAKNPLVLSLVIRNDQAQTVYAYRRPGAPLETMGIPVRYAGIVAGTIEISSALALVRTRVEALEIPASVAGGAFLVLVMIFAPLVLNLTVLRPILSLGRLVQRNAPQTLSREGLGPRSRIREVRALETAFGALASAVRENVETLEARVAERTSALTAARAQLSHAEALATLGQLTAGIAHELNTPLAAILSASRTLREEVHEDLLRLVSARWTPSLVPSPLDFLRDVSARARSLDPRRSSGTQKRLKALWLAHGRDPEADLFDLLANEALGPVGETLAGWPQGTPEEQAVKVVVLSARLLGVIDVAAEKGARVVQALRGQLRHQDLEPSAWFSGAASLERCLLLHEGHLRPRLEVRRRYAADLAFYGPEGRLGQVWLNLIHNALDAVTPPGWISVEARVHGGWAEVRVGDSGPPVPADLKARLFEPYFTTKSTGLGLGLNLSRSIVSALGGQLTYEDSDGKAFLVRWPQPALGTAQDTMPPPPREHPGSLPQGQE